jgi:DNA modification methylase
VHRKEGHPAPFPEELPARLIALYTFGATEGFEGEIVLDPFCGTGTTCAAAKRMGRRFIGIDVSLTYVEIARERVEKAVVGDIPILVVGTPIWPTQAEAVEQAKRKFEPIGREAGEAKHKRRRYGRKVPPKTD